MNIPVDIQVDFLWGENHFIKQNWDPITYVVGANGTGKSIFAEKLQEQFSKNSLNVRYFGADRINNLAGKWDTAVGQLSYDKTSKGLDMSNFDTYKKKAKQLGQSFDALIELQDKLDLQIKIESILSDIFHKDIIFQEKGGFLNVELVDQKLGNKYDLKKDESHGLKELITLLTFIYNNDYNCIILDEPELNLHPQFQQFILQEIKKNAGNPTEGKKMFVILTHSPYMLDINNSDDLLNYILFHKDVPPSYITEYDDDKYKTDRLNRLLLRINTNHKTMFFASSPVFVEGYIDQQLLNIIESKRDIPLGVEGVSIIDVGGKDEVDIMYSLCLKLGIKAKAIVDLDALFEGKLRQTISDLSISSSYLAKQGQKDLMTTIGDLQKIVSEIAEYLLKIEQDTLSNTSDEFKDFYKEMKSLSGDKALQLKRRLTLLAVNRLPGEITSLLDVDTNTKLERLNALLTHVLNCFEQSNVFVLSKGEIENYYTTYVGNQYSITDSKKTDYFLAEYNIINTFSASELTEHYPELITLLDRLCPVTKIDTKRITSLKLSDWIHAVQSLFQANNSITKETIETHPKIQWEKYKRIITLIEFTPNIKEKSFICKFKINSNLVGDSDITYKFTEKTVPSLFTL